MSWRDILGQQWLTALALYYAMGWHHWPVGMKVPGCDSAPLLLSFGAQPCAVEVGRKT